MQKNYLLCLLLIALLTMPGCGGKTNMESFLREEVDLTYVTRVAVVAFENNSKEQFAAERVRGMTITQILAQGLFDVVDKGLVDSALREEAVDLNKAPMDAPTLKRLGQRLNVQAFLLGTIDQAGDVQRGNTSYPELSITLRLVDTNTGMIFWQASGSRSGDSMGKRLFGLGSDDEFKIALRLLRQILATISSERRVKLPVAAAPPAKPSAPEPAPASEAQEQGSTDAQGETSSPDQAEPDTAAEEPSTEQTVPMGADESLSQETPAEPAASDAVEVPAKEELPPEPEPSAKEELPPEPEPPAKEELPPEPEPPAKESASPAPETPTAEALPQGEQPPSQPAASAPELPAATPDNTSTPQPTQSQTSDQDAASQTTPAAVQPSPGEDEWPE